MQCSKQWTAVDKSGKEAVSRNIIYFPNMEPTASNVDSTANEWTRDGNVKITFMDDNPHRKGTALFQKYEDVKTATTVGQAKERGASAWNLKEWKEKERISIGIGGAGGGQGIRGSGGENVKDEGGDGGEKRKLDFRGADEGAEPNEVEKERRQEDLEKIRKLEGVKEKLSPAKKKGKIDNEEDVVNVEMSDENEVGKEFQIHTPQRTNKMPTSSNAAADFQNVPVTMENLSNLLDTKLEPMKQNISEFYTALTEYKNEVNVSIVSLKTDFDRQLAILHQDVQAEIVTLHTKCDSVSQEIGNHKRLLGDAVLDGSLSENALKIQKLEHQLQELTLNMTNSISEDLAQVRWLKVAQGLSDSTKVLNRWT